MNPAPPLALYIHVPWCERKCPYCDFNSHALREAAPDWAAYSRALLADFEAEYALAEGRPIGSVFFGGGTPSLLPAPQLATLLHGLRARAPFTRAVEITLEANPGSSEAAKFAAFRAAGVNRLSIGIQSFDDGCLVRLGRIHDGRQARAAVAAARAAGFDNFNLDLMHGLPGQTPDMALDDLAQACDFAPPHLSWYQLTLEPNTPFHRQPPPALPDADALEAIAVQGARLLRARGWRQYEVSAWARARRQCRHNLNYWRFGDYIGIGAGAHGKLTLADGRILRRWKARLPREYLAAVTGGKLVAGAQVLPPQDARFEFLLNALRLKAGVPRALARRAGQSPEALEAHLAPLVARGLIRLAGGRVRASALGYAHLNRVLRDLLPEAAPENNSQMA